jgi:hypothetical protein
MGKITLTPRLRDASGSSVTSLAALLILGMAVIAPGGARGAGIQGSLSGSVTDASGAVIPGASVVIRNTQTGVRWRTITNATGFYAFSSLPAGEYELEIAHAGFAPYRRRGLVIDVAAELRADARLTVGGRRQTITVSGVRVQVNTSNAQTGQVITDRKMTTLPLNGRSYTDLLALQPGVAPASTIQPNSVVMTGVNTSIVPSGDLNPGNISISGQREFANGFVLNGTDVEERVNMGTAIIPNLDSIAEFRILTSNFDAQYGNYAGGEIVVATKSGGNQLHGDAFEFLRNTSLDARNFFSPDRAQFNQDQFGATLGGAVRRDKTFFFADYQGTRLDQGVDTGLIPVPSLAERQGDFSAVAGELTGKVNGQYFAGLLAQALHQPVTAGEKYYSPGCVSALECVFPNAVIPAAVWSSPAARLLQYIPLPNQPGDFFSTSAYDLILRDDKGSARLDSETPWGALSAYYLVDRYALNNPYPVNQAGANLPGFNALSSGLAQFVSLADTKTSGAGGVNEFRLGFVRDASLLGQPSGGVGSSLASQGFVTGAGTAGIVPLDPRIEGIENVVFNNFTIGLDTTGMGQFNNSYEATDNFSRVAGTHLVKAGGELIFAQVNVIPDFIYNGSFQFYGTATGNDFADFLIGAPSAFGQGDGQAVYERNPYYGLFAQDTWRPQPSLSLDYGLRWDAISPWYEKYNQIQTLSLGEQSQVFPGAPKGLVFPGDPGIPRTLAPARYGDFAPRLGWAWSPDFQRGILGRLLGPSGKTSIRAGYGVFYTAIEGLSIGVDSANIPWGYSYTSPAPPLFATPYVTAANGAFHGQPFPLQFPPFGVSASHPNASVNFAKFLPDPFGATYNPGNQTPYAEHYVFSIQRQLTANTVLSLDYVGAQAHHLLVVLEENPGNPALCLGLSQQANVMPGTPTCGPFGESGTYVSNSGKVYNGTRGPFGAAFTSATTEHAMGNSNFNALEVTLQQTTRRTELLAGYTYSKSMDQSSSLAEQVNPLNYRLTEALSSFDLTHNFVASYHYQIPLEGLFRRQTRLATGWSVSGVTRFTTGFPVTFFNNNDTSLLGTQPDGVNNFGVDLPNYTPGPLELNSNPRNGRPYFNTSLFSLPSLGSSGTAARRFFYGPGLANFDLALLKTIPMGEAKSLEIRLETLNTFNHAQFFGAGAVNGVVSTPGFGEVVMADSPRLVQLAAKLMF